MSDVRRTNRGLDACIDTGVAQDAGARVGSAVGPVLADRDQLVGGGPARQARDASPGPRLQSPDQRACFSQSAGRWLRDTRTGALVRTSAPAPVSVDQPGATRVWTGTFAIARDGAVLQSSGAGPCVIVTLRDPVTKVAAMTHLHPAQDVSASLDAMLAAARRAGLDPARAEVHVLGGLSATGADELAPAALVALRARGLTIAEADVLGMTPRSVQLDVRSGVVSRYEEREDNGEARTHEGPVAVELRAPTAGRPQRR